MKLLTLKNNLLRKTSNDLFFFYLSHKLITATRPYLSVFDSIQSIHSKLIQFYGMDMLVEKNLNKKFHFLIQVKNFKLISTKKKTKKKPIDQKDSTKEFSENTWQSKYFFIVIKP